jgi:hypothetical protein
VKSGRNVAVVSGGGGKQGINFHLDPAGLRDLTIQMKKGPRRRQPSAKGIIGIGFVRFEVVSSSCSAQCQSDLSEGR